MNTIDDIKPKLLIVEDDFDNQRFLEFLLKSSFELVVCDSGEEMYQVLETNRYDVFLMDISLKGKKNGLQLIQELRQLEEYKNAPIICLTAHAFIKDRENAINAGADVFLIKPVPNRTLIDSIYEVINSKAKRN
jgi:two-component system sensor histidine kinase BarA